MKGSINQSDNSIPSPSTSLLKQLTPNKLDLSLQDNEKDWIDISDFDVLKTEQSVIDSTLKTLLNYKVNIKKAGRPLKSNTNLSEPQTPNPVIPDTVRTDLKSLVNISELHPGILLDYLIKVNTLNKKLLSNCELLSKKCNELNDKIKDSTNNVIHPVTPVPPRSAEHSTSPLPRQPNEPVASTITDDLFSKVDNLEQKANSNVILCSGPSITNIATGTDANDLSKIKTDLVNKLQDIVPDTSETDFLNVSFFGKERKQLKITCNNISIRSKLLKEIKRKKPENIFLSEFLTSFRSKLYYELRQLRKKNPTKITAAYTRNGNIYYKLINDDKFYNVRYLQDIRDLKLKLDL